MTLASVSPDMRVRPRRALLAAAAALAALFIHGFASDVSAQSGAPRPVARMIGSSAPRPLLAAPSRCAAARTSYVAASSAPAGNSFERRAFELINDERRSRGQEPLRWDGELTRIARQHSENMARQNFFSHTDRDGLDTADRAAVGGVCGWRAIAENIAYNQGFEDPVGFAVERWMQSPKHRENILRQSFTHAGVGVSRGPDGRVYFTQVFVAR